MPNLTWNKNDLESRDSLGTTTSNYTSQGYELGSLKDGLIAYYPFDGGVEDHALNNDGIDNTSADYVPGKIGDQAKDFDGQNDYIDTFNFGLSKSQSFTISSWVNLDDNSSLASIFGRYDGTNILDLKYNSNTPGWNFRIGHVGGNQIDLEPGNPANENEWYHLTAVFNSDSQTAKLYVNGDLVSSETNSVDDFATSNAPTIGMRNDGAANLNGQIDDLRVYERALSLPEIRKLYQRTSTQKIKDKDRITTGLIGHWSLNEDTASTAYDLSGRNNDSTSVTGTSSVSGLGGAKARNFGTSSGQINLPTFSLNNTSGGLSFGVFIKPYFDTTSTSGLRIWRWKSGGSNNTGFGWGGFHGGSGDLNFEWSDAGMQYNVNENWQGEWKHLFFVADDQDPVTLKIFVDGQEVKSGGVSGNQTVNGSSNSYLGVGDGYAFDLTDFRIYNRALTESEIRTIALMGGIE